MTLSVRKPLNNLDGRVTHLALDAFLFSAQYQQQPVPLDGELIKWGWFGAYEEEPSLQEYDRIVQSWDTAMTPGATADYSVCTTWLVRKNHFFLLDVTRAKLDFPSLRSRVIAHAREWKANNVLIENKGSGQSLIQELRRTPGAPQPMLISVSTDKVTRLSTVTAMIEQGQVFLPKTASWLDDFKSELLQFPNGRHDDQVDSLSQFLNRKRTQSLHYSGASEGSKLITLERSKAEEDADIVDDWDADHSNDGFSPIY